MQAQQACSGFFEARSKTCESLHPDSASWHARTASCSWRRLDAMGIDNIAAAALIGLGFYGAGRAIKDGLVKLPAAVRENFKGVERIGADGMGPSCCLPLPHECPQLDLCLPRPYGPLPLSMASGQVTCA